MPRWAAVVLILCVLAWLVLNPAGLAGFVSTVFSSVSTFFENL